MLFKNRLILASLLFLLVMLVAIWFTPFAISNGLRFWVWWSARQEGLIVKIDKIDAPFLRPVMISSLHVTSAPENAFHIDLAATQTSVDLNFKRILLRSRGPAIRTVSIQQLHGDLRRINLSGRAITPSGWATLHKLLPQDLTIANSDMRIEDGPTVILLRNVFLSASEVEAGRFSAGEVMIASPWFRQTFSQLRGATNWQADRMALAGLRLTRGLDLQSISVDLSRLSKQRVGLDFDLDAFGGKIRASISHEWHSKQATWKIAGSGADISLAQTSEAIGFTDRVDGLLHACNFTFRGNPSDPTRATASFWTELTGLTWRNRTAEAIMLGAALYSRQIELQQLYIKQKANQLTLSGEASFPSNSSDWFSPDFRGDISASISNLGDFASLFGANAGDFAGEIVIDGAMNARDRKIGGHLMASGASLKIFKTSIDTLSAKLNLKVTELEIEYLDMKRRNDSLSAQGKIDMSHAHGYSGTFKATADNLADYFSIFRESTESNSKPMPVSIEVTIDSSRWDARGVVGLPDPSALNFTAGFLLPIGTDWNAFLASPLNITLDFPSIFLANAPQIFHPGIFRDGILSGKLSLSETLQHPRIIGDVQLVNGKLQNAPLNLTEASGRLAFAGEHASIDFLNVTTKDADLSFGGEIDFPDANDLAIKITAVTPIFDVMPHQIDCVSRIEIESVPSMLAPAVAGLDIRGGLFRSDWTVSLKEETGTQSFAALNLIQTDRTLPLCLGASREEKTLLLGAPARPEVARETIRPRPKRTKRH